MHVIVIAIPITAKHGVEFCLDFAQLYFNVVAIIFKVTLLIHLWFYFYGLCKVIDIHVSLDSVS
jgi:hypothetical protein